MLGVGNVTSFFLLVSLLPHFKLTFIKKISSKIKQDALVLLKCSICYLMKIFINPIIYIINEQVFRQNYLLQNLKSL